MNPDADPDRHIKRLEKVFGVSAQIHGLVLKREKSSHQLTKEQEIQETLAKSKIRRTERLNNIGQCQHYVLDIAADYFGVQTDTIINGIADADQDVELMKSFAEANGKLAIMLFYEELPHPPLGNFFKDFFKRYPKMSSIFFFTKSLAAMSHPRKMI